MNQPTNYSNYSSDLSSYNTICMNFDDLRTYALSKPGAEEAMPFGETTLVFKVKGKLFLLTNIDAQPLQCNVKCDPERAIELREEYECIIPGYHMNKKHWNTIIIDGSLSNKQLREMIDHSYNLVAKIK
jgi:predicted DNA-binding protein (MmcQ/YjbR family)